MLDLFLFVLFAVHLVAFLILAIRRRTVYHSLLTLLFSLLVLSYGFKLYAPEVIWGSYAAFQWLRWTAWAVAVVTLPWLAVRIMSRVRARKAAQSAE